LLGTEILKPGHSGFLQLELSRPVVANRGDRYIIRRPSPGQTIGGGVVIDPAPKGRHKRFDKKVLDRLNSLLAGTPADILLQTISAEGIISMKEAIGLSSLEREAANEGLEELVDTGVVFGINEISEATQGAHLILTKTYFTQIKSQVKAEIDDFIRQFPLRLGIPREVLKSKLDLATREFNAIVHRLVEEGELCESLIRKDMPGVSPIPVVHSRNHQIQFSPEQQKVVNALLNKFAAAPYTPPTIKLCISESSEDIYNALVDLGHLIPLSDEVVFKWEDYQDLVEQVKRIIFESGSISVAQMRDRFNTSRRYVLAFLEHLDLIGITVREGDVRKLRG
jgi:selenocysteine-specific elongation factor